MRQLFIILLVLISSSVFGQQLENNSYNNKYYYKNNRLYGPDSTRYDGRYKEYYPGETKVEGEYVNGLKHGKFMMYGNLNHNLIGIENYCHGTKHGEFKTYYADNYWVQNLISLETYYYDTLRSAYYWDRSGQLIKSIINNQIKTYSVDTAVWTIIPYIKGQNCIIPPNDLKPYFVISEKFFCSKDSAKIKVAKITCEPCWDADNTIIDTTVLDTYKVLSFSTGYNVQGDFSPNWNITGNIFPAEIKANICNVVPPCIWIEDLVIVDNYGIKYYLPSIRYGIKK